MTLLRDMPLNGPGSWYSGSQIQIDSTSYNPPDVPNGVPGYMDWVSDPLGQRGTVLRSQVGAYVSGSFGPRSEINMPNEPLASGSPVCRSYRWAMMVPSAGMLNDSPRAIVVAQIHDNPDGGDGARWPIMVMWVTGDELQLMLPRVNPPTDGDAGSRVAASVRGIRDRWMDIQFSINLSIEATPGWLEWIVDGVLIHRETCHGTAYDDAIGPWHKLGCYNISKYTDAGVIGTAYYTACQHHAPPYSTGPVAAISRQIAGR